MQATRDFQYWDHETKKSVRVSAGETLSERAVNILGDGKIAQMSRTRHFSDDTVIVKAPTRKRGRTKKGA